MKSAMNVDIGVVPEKYSQTLKIRIITGTVLGWALWKFELKNI